MKIKSISFLLTMLISMIGTKALADVGVVDGIYYEFSGKEATVITSHDIDGYTGAVVIPEEVTYNGSTYTVTSIGSYSFRNTKLTDITIPNSVTDIFENTFRECLNLASVDLPASLTDIASDAFNDCHGLKQIISRATVPPTCGFDVFMNVDKENCMLIVPAVSMNDYKNANQWKDFHMIKDYETDIRVQRIENREVKYIYSPEGKPLQQMQRGLNIVVSKDGTVKKVLVK